MKLRLFKIFPVLILGLLFSVFASAGKPVYATKAIGFPHAVLAGSNQGMPLIRDPVSPWAEHGQGQLSPRGDARR